MLAADILSANLLTAAPSAFEVLAAAPLATDLLSAARFAFCTLCVVPIVAVPLAAVLLAADLLTADLNAANALSNDQLAPMRTLLVFALKFFPSLHKCPRRARSKLANSLCFS